MLNIPKCLECKNLIESSISEGDVLKCSAFPEGIPKAILTNEHDHREPYEGDNGITFEPLTPSKD